MRELDRIPTPHLACAIVGAGRLGTALAAALRAAGVTIDGPLGRGADPRGVDAMLLCVPDAEIAAAAAAVTPGVPVGHCSGATGLDVLVGHEAFGLHPLMTVPSSGAPAFAGAGCAVAGSSPRALAIAEELAARLGMRATTVADADRAAYHAAASIAANFLVTLEGAAERLAASAGVERALLAPLVRAAVENWARLGAAEALTGPIARGDEATVDSQRAAVAERTPDLLALFDALADATRALAATPGGRRPAVKTVHTIAAVRAQVAAARRAGRRVGLVPTMGAFHAGHEALMRAARAACDEVVVSLFVNPAQFEEAGDLIAYPRTAERDAAIAAEHGVDVLFAPALAEVYPAGFATTIRVAGLSDVLEGAARGAAHFDGVCTIVCKLLTIVAPDVAFFGQKDAQQVVVIRRMVRDLDLPVELEVVPTVREPDGLALSSRNVRLGPRDRRRARSLRAGLDAVAAAVAGGERDRATAEAAGRAAMAAAGVEPGYLSIVDPDTLAAVEGLSGRVLAVVAARVGPVRLIDNILIDTEQVATRDPRAPTPAKEQRCPPHPASTSATASRAGP